MGSSCLLSAAISNTTDMTNIMIMRSRDIVSLTHETCGRLDWVLTCTGVGSIPVQCSEHTHEAQRRSRLSSALSSPVTVPSERATDWAVHQMSNSNVSTLLNLWVVKSLCSTAQSTSAHSTSLRFRVRHTQTDNIVYIRPIDLFIWCSVRRV